MDRRDSANQLVDDVMNGRLTRRDLMARAAALSLSGAVIAELLAACGGNESAPSPTAASTVVGTGAGSGTPVSAAATTAPSVTTNTTASPSAPAAASPVVGVPGGTVTIAFPSAPLRIDPALAISGDEYMLTQAIYNNPVRIDEKLQVQPDLAKSWNVTDGVNWTFTLQQGVKFHHGKDFKAEDVVFSIKRILDPATASSGQSTFSMIDSMSTPDDYTVVFKLKFLYADFPYALGSTFGRIVPSDRTNDQIAKEPVGTGPFKMQAYAPGSQIVMVKNENYWEKGLPYLDKVIQIQIPEQTGLAAALKAGQIQVFWQVAPGTLSSVKDDPKIAITEIPSPSFQPIGMRADQPPFNNVKVRQALMYCLDRKGIVQAVLQGHGTETNDNTVPTISPFWKDTGMKKRDIAKAKSLLTEAGFPNGLDVEIIASNQRDGLVEQATILKQLAAEAGFRINIKVVPWDVFNAQYYKKSTFYVNNWFGRPTIDETLYPYFHTDGSWNDYHYSNPKVDELLEAGRKETDVEKRKQIYGQVQDILVTEGPAGVAYHSTFITALQKQVRGYVVHPIRWVDLRWTYLQK